MRLLDKTPAALTSLRMLLAPAMVMLAMRWPHQAAFGVCLTLAFLSDVFDGILARKLGVATPALRRFDSMADTAFYVAATFAAWHLHPQAIKDNVIALLTLGAIEVARYAFDLLKFGREASYHMWSSKAWGVVLFVTFFALLVSDYAGPWIAAAIYVGIIADLEGLAISCVLPEWKSDVPSLVHAFRSRASTS